MIVDEARKLLVELTPAQTKAVLIIYKTYAESIMDAVAMVAEDDETQKKVMGAVLAMLVITWTGAASDTNIEDL